MCEWHKDLFPFLSLYRQVYKARLKANGDTVALKIQRPGCEEIIALDLYVLRWWSGIYSRIFELLNRDINVQSIIDQFGELIYREIDYVAEAANAQRFNELYAGVKDVFVPKIYSELTTSKVLTMEWVDGFRLTDVETLRRYGLDETKLIETLTEQHAANTAERVLPCRSPRRQSIGMPRWTTMLPRFRNDELRSEPPAERVFTSGGAHCEQGLVRACPTVLPVGLHSGRNGSQAN